MKANRPFSVKSLLMILLGNMLMAVAAHLFLEPSGLVTGGVMGIALALSHATGARVSIFAMILNVICFALGWALIGKKYALSTLISTISYPLFTAILEFLFPEAALTGDCMLNAVFAGLLTGIALGLVIREGSSTGGADCVPIAISKRFGLPVSACVYVMDFTILFGQLLVYSVESILFGLVNVLIYSIVMDKIILAGDSRTEVKIISESYDKIRDAILVKMDRGVTMLSAEGGYKRNRTSLVLSVISNRELPQLRRLVESIDPHALIIVNRVSQVSGRGFTLDKEYR